jgi:two-component system nitrogen regulation sensor histidine kinase NtrY
MTSTIAVETPGAWGRLRAWNARVGLARKLAFALAALATISGVATYIALTGSAPFGGEPRTILILLNIDLALLLTLAAVILKRLVALWAARRRGLAGARLLTRMVGLFGVVAVTPAIVVAVGSVLFFQFGVQTWFSERVRTALDQSLQAAEAYLREHQNAVRGDVLAMANDLNRQSPQLIVNPQLFERVVNAQAAVRNLSEAVVLDGSGNILARAGLSFSLELERLPMWAVDQAREGGVPIMTGEADDRVRALVKLERFADAFLFVGRFIDPTVLAHISKTQQAVAAYRSLEGRSSSIQITFALVFMVVALLLLLTAAWLGIVFATRLVRPVGELINAAERVRAGELSTRVAEARDDDELALLGRAFNRMTQQIEAQRGELVEANNQLDMRRRFTEAVLDGVSAGVIGLDDQGRIYLPNRSATMLLGIDLVATLGRELTDVLPELAELFQRVRARPDRRAEGQIEVVRQNRRRTLHARIAAELADDRVRGYVVTFDDVSDLMAAQRAAAWSDIARRIAHEIKNPLTPIQLSAERLRRKYLKEITNDPETFAACTDTIVRQVGDIGRLVDEFSAFARMPAPVFAIEDVTALAREQLTLQRQAHGEVAFETDLPDQPVRLRCDARQLRQCLTNLLQNAIDAIEGRRQAQGPAAPAGRVALRLRVEPGQVALEVEDNGKGLPPELDRAKLVEPYVTTRAKGTGLGLAIVKKIMEDHRGVLVLEDAPGGGARVRLLFDTADAGGREGDPAPAERDLTAAHGA